jgi:hypothetical protein
MPVSSNQGLPNNRYCYLGCRGLAEQARLAKRLGLSLAQQGIGIADFWNPNPEGNFFISGMMNFLYSLHRKSDRRLAGSKFGDIDAQHANGLFRGTVKDSPEFFF